jgi:hypothetical protein
MEDNLMNNNVAQVDAVPAAEPKKKVVRKPATRKASGSEVRLALPVPYNANKSANLVLLSSMKDKFPLLALVKAEDKLAKSKVQVLGNADLGNLVNFVAALVTSWTGGTGIAADGSALYVKEFHEIVLRTVPTLKGYDLLFSTSQSGPSSYRIAVTEMLKQVLDRAVIVEKNIRQFGLSNPRSHKSAAKSAPVVKL